MVGNFFPFKIEMSSSHCSLLLLVICFCTQLFAGQLTIVLPEKPSAFETNAAKELSSFIEAASGTAPAILHEPGKSPERAIFVGSTRFAEASAAQVPDGDEAWLNQEIDGNLVLLGNGRRGTLYAVYEFLEHNLGIVFLDDWNTYIPKTAEITWKAGMLRSGVPSFAVRGFNSYIIQDERGQSRFSARMRQNFFSYYIPADYPAAYRGCIDVVGSPDFAHTYYHYTKTLSTSQQNILSWSERHQRRIVSTSSAGPGQICYSNPETAEWFARILR